MHKQNSSIKFPKKLVRTEDIQIKIKIIFPFHLKEMQNFLHIFQIIQKCIATTSAMIKSLVYSLSTATMRIFKKVCIACFQDNNYQLSSIGASIGMLVSCNTRLICHQVLWRTMHQFDLSKNRSTTTALSISDASLQKRMNTEWVWRSNN